MNINKLKPVRLIFSVGIVLLSGVFKSVVAETVGPTVYGKVNVSLEKIDDEGAARVVRGSEPAVSDQWELNSNASRLGVKGEFDLDKDGLKAIYQAEYEINVDDGANGDTAFSQRNIFGGLKGGFGQVIFGKFDTPLKTAEGKVDQFNDLRSDIDALIGGQNRVSNIVQYSTPKFGETVQLNAAFIPAEGSDVDLDGESDDGIADTISASLVAEGDGWYGALAFESDQTARRSIDGISRGDIIRAVGAVKRGAFEAGLLLQQVSDAVSGSDLEDTSVLLSGAFNFSQTIKLKAQYGISEGDSSGEEGTLTAFGVDYAFAKKSILYAYLSSLSLDIADLTDDSFGIGVAHSF